MTYCVGLFLDRGMVMLADTRTNAGFDNISCFSKLNTFHRPGERMIASMSAGNLAISQAIINRIQDGLPDPETGEVETIYSIPTMSRAAALVGEAVRRVYHTHNPVMAEQNVSFDVSIMLGGQIAGRTMRLFYVMRPVTSSKRPPTCRSCRSASTSTASRFLIAPSAGT